MSTIISGLSTIPLATSFRNGIEQQSRGRLENVFGPHVDRLLSGAEKVAGFHERSFVHLLSSFNLTTVPEAYAHEFYKSAACVFRPIYELPPVRLPKKIELLRS